MNTNPGEEPRTASVREEWTQALSALEKNLTEWSKEEGWQIRPVEKVFTEESTGQYTAPDLVILYREPILLEWIEGGEDLFRLVRNVLIHEIAHHFGFSDADIAALEAEDD